MNGALLAADQINAQGGVLGKRITIDAIDNACDPQTAVQAAQKAVADGVVGLAGDTCSGAEIPELRVFNPLHLPVVLVAATNPTVLGQGVGNIFRVVGNDNSQGSFAADFLVNYLNAKKIALIGDNTTYTVGLLAATQDELQKLGATVVFNDNINPADTDFTAEMQRAKATNPDAIYITPQAGPTGLVVRDARKVGYQGILMAAEVNALVLQEAGPGINDLYQDTYPDANQLPQAATFIQQYKAKFNADPVPESANGYVAVMVLVDAIRRANSTDAQKIVAALGTTDYNGITGNIKFTSTGENANPQFIALKAVNGAWVGYKRFDGTNWVDVVSTTP
jgi:ABC-type branched-subunit amino acid transport system substrate-binding protein